MTVRDLVGMLIKLVQYETTDFLSPLKQDKNVIGD